MPPPTFGHPPGVPVGTEFATRRELRAAGVHRPTRAGICGTAATGAESIVLSGGYEDDEDRGDVILYTGHGGRDDESGRQVEHQTPAPGTLALIASQERGLGVRVVRGASTPHGPRAGYRYDGLYRVAAHWQELGKSGYVVWRFRLERI